MAEDEKDKGGEDAKATPPKKKRSPMIIVAIAVAGSAVLGGVGGAFLMKGGGSTEEHAADPGADTPAPETTAEEGHGKPEKAPSKEHGAASGGAKDEGKLLELDQFIVNLADTPEIRYLKVSVMLQVAEGKAPKITDRMPQIRDSLLILLSSKTSDAIRTVEGKMELREEIVQRVNSVVEANLVTAAYFTDFVAQ
ncbi:MAG: flagellar basal body-associated FliL family protein [Nitrospirota bacterium]